MAVITPEGFSYSTPEPAITYDIRATTGNTSLPNAQNTAAPFNIRPPYRRPLRVVQ